MVEQINIGNKTVDFEQILNAGGIVNFEINPGSGRYFNAVVTDSFIDIRPQEPSDFFFRAEVHNSDEIIMNVCLRDKQGKRNKDLPRGRDLVETAFEFFQKYHTITKFVGTWLEDSDNLSQFLTNIKHYGMTDKLAVFNTWTGVNIALRFGFTNVDNVFKDLISDQRFVIVRLSRVF